MIAAAAVWLMLAAALAAAAIAAALIVLIRPQLQKFALAKPNARSSHTLPTPQGAGIAVIAATLAAAGTALTLRHETSFPLTLFVATMFIAAVGLADDMKPIPVLPRLVLQSLAIGAVVVALPAAFRIAPFVPLAIERGLLLLAGLWFVNLVNFMDGIDWITVAEAVPVTAAIVLLGLLGKFPMEATIVAAALCGAMIGFAPFNRPVAKIFLGDVGSLPIGLLLGWCLVQLAGQHHLAAAILLPMYYLADATVTLLRRLMRGEPFWVAHRTHFYQRATDNGFSVLQVVGEVFLLNLALATLAVTSVKIDSPALDIVLLASGAGAVAQLLFRFSRKRA